MEQIVTNEQFDADDEAEFEYDWLTREKLQFKILALIAVLANSHLAYRGTLADIREFLGISGCDSRQNNQIKAAIAALEADGLLKQIVDGRTYTLTLSKAAEKKSRVIRIQKEWVIISKNYKNWSNKSESVDWSVLLKVWLFLIDRGLTSKLITNQKIGDALGIKAGTVKNARGALQKDFHALMSQKVYEYNPELDQPFRCLGSEITATAWITDEVVR